MKKFLVVALTLMVVGMSSASAQAVWGARVGLSRPTMSISGDWTESIDGKFGLELGPVLYYSLKSNWYINTGAMFSIKTFDFGEGDNLSVYYLSVPVYAGYNIPVGKVSLYAQAGPYAGFKLGESEDSGTSSLDAGLGLMGGINVKRFKIEVGYQIGMANLADSELKDWGVKMKLNSLFLGVSYVF